MMYIVQQRTINQTVLFLFVNLTDILKVLTNDKRGELTVVLFDRSLFKLFHARDFQTNRCRPHPLGGLKLLS